MLTCYSNSSIYWSFSRKENPELLLKEKDIILWNYCKPTSYQDEQEGALHNVLCISGTLRAVLYDEVERS